MKRLAFSLLFFISQLNCYSQGVDNLWMMGYESFFGGPPFGGVNIDFFSGSPVISYIARPMYFSDISATMCDTSGNVLFYTNGVYIADVTDDTMMNGSSLSPSYYTSVVGSYGLHVPQAAIFISNPSNPSKYYLFHNTIDDSVAYSYHMYYSEIDVSLNSGFGAVITKNNTLLNDTLIPGRITAVKHGNGRDWWVVFHEGHTSRYYIYLIDLLGIHFFASQNIGSNLVSTLGQVCFSPDGSKFAMYDALNDLDILDFNRCTGQFSNPVHVAINDSAAGGGVAFSSNSNVLYVSSTKYVYQFDMTSTNIPSSKVTVAIWDMFYSPSPPAAATFYLSQLAPDGKIYISCTNGTLDIHVIDYPDSLGMACQVCQHCVHLPAYNGFTIPNHPNYHLGALQGSICDTITATRDLHQGVVKEVNLFPNPVRERVYAVLSQSIKIKSVKIFNAFGQEVNVNFSFIKNGEYLEVNTVSLSQGVYFLELLSEKEKIVKRFVKE